VSIREKLIRRLHPSPLGTPALQLERVLRAPLQYARRKLMARRAQDEQAIPIDRRLGFASFRAQDLPLGLEVVRQSEEVYERTRRFVPWLHDAQLGRHGIAFDILSDDRLLAWPTFLDFALSRTVLATATAYLGIVPVLRRIALGLSRFRADLTTPSGSQLFHFDREDTTQLKLYMTVSSVASHQGPLHFLTAETSARVVDALRKRARRRLRASSNWLEFSDAEVFEHCDPSELHSLEGPPGTGLLLDTSRCLHFGSRMTPGSERLLAYLAFQRYHMPDPRLHNSFDRARYRGDRLRDLALTPPTERPFGFFYPNPILAPGPGARGSVMLADEPGDGADAH
jgi:hypothetical protein